MSHRTAARKLVLVVSCLAFGPIAQAKPLDEAAAALEAALSARVQIIAAEPAPSEELAKEGKSLIKASALLSGYGGGESAAELKLLVKVVAMTVKSATADADVIEGVEELIACGIELVRTQTSIVETALEELRSEKFRAKVDKLLAKVGLTFDQALARVLADPAGAAKLIVKAIFLGRKSEAVAVKLLAVEAAAGGGAPPCTASQGTMTAVIDGVPFVADRILARFDRSRGTGQVTFATINGSSGSGPGARFLNFDFLAGEISFRGADTYVLGPHLPDGSANWLRSYYREDGVPTFDGVTGTLIIDVFDIAGDRITGRFSYTGSNGTSSRSIMEGAFEITCLLVMDVP